MCPNQTTARRSTAAPGVWTLTWQLSCQDLLLLFCRILWRAMHDGSLHSGQFVPALLSSQPRLYLSLPRVAASEQDGQSGGRPHHLRHCQDPSWRMRGSRSAAWTRRWPGRHRLSTVTSSCWLVRVTAPSMAGRWNLATWTGKLAQDVMEAWEEKVAGVKGTAGPQSRPHLNHLHTEAEEAGETGDPRGHWEHQHKKQQEQIKTGWSLLWAATNTRNTSWPQVKSPHIPNILFVICHSSSGEICRRFTAPVSG